MNTGRAPTRLLIGPTALKRVAVCYRLVDMLVHDINVVADLTKHDPTAPSPEDGTPIDGTRAGVAEGQSPIPQSS